MCNCKCCCQYCHLGKIDNTKEVMNLIKKVVTYEKKLSDGCTCSSDDEHSRLGCVPLKSFIAKNVEEINELLEEMNE